MASQICFIVKVTTRCNLNCTYCYEEKENQDMGWEVAEALIDKSLGAFDMVQYCWHGGEPLLKGRDFFTRVKAKQDALQDRGSRIRNTLQTNGTLLNDDWSQWLTAESFRVGVSCDGVTCHDIHRQNFAGNGSYDEVNYNLLRLKEIDGGTKYPGGLLAVVTPYMIEHQDGLLEEFASMGVKHADLLRCKTEIEGVTSEEYYAFMRGILQQWLKLDNPGFKIRTIDATLDYLITGRSRLCRYLGDCKRFLTVRPNGDVYPCECLHGSTFYQKLGNILVDEISVIEEAAACTVCKVPEPEECAVCEFKALCQGICQTGERAKGKCYHRKMFFRELADLVDGVKVKSEAIDY